MLVEKAVSPDYAELRPLKPRQSAGFPVYAELPTHLATAKDLPDATVAHTLAVAAGYAYSDADTVSMIMARMGLPGNHCLMVSQYVDAMFVNSTAFLIQSADGSVVILAYRGTQPTDLISWLTDADVHPDRIALAFPGAPEGLPVHAGFYRNVRATRYEVVAALLRALNGRSVLDQNETMAPLESPMTTLYLTGHSLGGAMAALMSVMLVLEPEYADKFGDAFRASYTFGQPMIGSPTFAAACSANPALNAQMLRYIYRHDAVPQLPPLDSGDFAHFGREFRYDGSWPWPDTSEQPLRQMSNMLGLLQAPLAFVARQFRMLRTVPFQYSLNDHGPQHYIAALTPRGVPNEFGDAAFVPDN
jgi:hypothetical protein